MPSLCRPAESRHSSLPCASSDAAAPALPPVSTKAIIFFCSAKQQPAIVTTASRHTTTATSYKPVLAPLPSAAPSSASQTPPPPSPSPPETLGIPSVPLSPETRSVSRAESVTGPHCRPQCRLPEYVSLRPQAMLPADTARLGYPHHSPFRPASPVARHHPDEPGRAPILCSLRLAGRLRWLIHPVVPRQSQKEHRLAGWLQRQCLGRRHPRDWLLATGCECEAWTRRKVGHCKRLLHGCRFILGQSPDDRGGRGCGKGL